MASSLRDSLKGYLLPTSCPQRQERAFSKVTALPPSREGLYFSIPTMRASSASRSCGLSLKHRVNVFPSCTSFVTRKCRTAREASCGQCVIRTIWRREDKASSCSATLLRVRPPTPASTLIENERSLFAVRLDGDHRQHKTGKLTAGSDLVERLRLLSGVGRPQQSGHDLLGSRGTTLRCSIQR